MKNFFYDALDQWNKLPISIRNQNIAPKQFKLSLVKHGNYSNTLKLAYFFGNRRYEYIFNRIDLDLSGLNSNLFRHNLIDDPGCVCGNANETTYHYLFDCQEFNIERTDLLIAVNNVPDLSIHRNSKQLMKMIIDMFYLPPSPSSSIVAQSIQMFIEKTKRFDTYFC